MPAKGLCFDDILPKNRKSTKNLSRPIGNAEKIVIPAKVEFRMLVLQDFAFGKKIILLN